MPESVISAGAANQLALDFTAQDRRRLAAQQARVEALMADGQWRTLAQIAAVTHDPEASISARLRESRRVGGFRVERRRVREGGGQWEYRLSSQPKGA